MGRGGEEERMNSCLVVLGLEAFRMLRGDHLDDQVISVLGIITFFTIGNVIFLIVERFSEYHLRLTKLMYRWNKMIEEMKKQ